MAGRAIDCIVESLMKGDLSVDDFMRAVQKNIEHLETESGEMCSSDREGKPKRLESTPLANEG